MKILLLNSSQMKGYSITRFKRAVYPSLTTPILAALTPSQHEIRIINNVVEEIDFDEYYDLVGISCMSCQAPCAYYLADEFMRRGTRVVLGGVHPTLFPEEATQHADAVVIGEAETIWQQVIDDAEMGWLEQIYQAESFPDLQQLTIPRWDLVNLEPYLKFAGKFPLMPIYTTKGCPYGCEFCTVTTIYGKSYRTKPIEHVLQEIEILAKIGAQDFFFVDDNICCQPQYARELFKALQNRDIRFIAQSSTMILKQPDLIDLAAKAGCFALFLGIESINPDSLAGVKKDFNKVELYKELFSRLYEAGIVPYVSMILGFDEDTPEQIPQTLEFLKENLIILAVFWILQILPRSILWDRVEQEGRILTKDWSLYDGTHAIFSPKHFTSQQLEDLYWQLFRDFCSLEYAQAVIPKLKQRFTLPNIYEILHVNLYQQVRAGLHPFVQGIEPI